MTWNAVRLAEKVRPIPPPLPVSSRVKEIGPLFPILGGSGPSAVVHTACAPPLERPVSHDQMASTGHSQPVPTSGQRARDEAQAATGSLCIREDYFGVDGHRPINDEKDFRRSFYVPRSVVLRIYSDIKTEPWWALPPPAHGTASSGSPPAGPLAVHPLHELVAAFRALSSTMSGAERSVEYVRLPEALIADAATRLVAFVLRKYVSDGGGGGAGGGGAATLPSGGGGEGVGADGRAWGAAAFSPAVFPGAYLARSMFVRKLKEWTELTDPAGHRKLTDALAAHGRARRAGLLTPDP